VANVR